MSAISKATLSYNKTLPPPEKKEMVSALAARISKWEQKACVTDLSRPFTITKGFGKTPEEKEAVKEYIQYLKEMIAEEEKPLNEPAEFHQINNTLINVGSRSPLNKNGTYGTLFLHEGKTFLKGDKDRTVLQGESFVSKHIKIVEICENEYRMFKSLSNKLNDQEKPYILPLITSICQKNQLTTYITEKFTDDCEKAHLLPTNTKNEISISLIKSLSILLKYGFILPDIKEKNALYKLTEGSCKAVLADYGQLMDFKHLVDNPNNELIYKHLKYLSIWEPTHLPYPEFLEAFYHLKEIYKNYETRKGELKESQNRFEKILMFSVGSLLFSFYPSDFLPHEIKKCNEFPNYLSNMKEYETQKPKPNSDNLTLLLENNCPPTLAAFIARMVSHNPEERPSLNECLNLAI